MYLKQTLFRIVFNRKKKSYVEHVLPKSFKISLGISHMIFCCQLIQQEDR